MQRSTALVYTLLLASAVALVVVKGSRGRRGAEPAGAAAADAGADAEVGAPRDAGEGGGAERAGDTTGSGGAAQTSDAGGTLLSGDAPPALAAEAPKRVRFGVVLVQYKGAQGAPRTARSRDEALELATQLVEDARQDFKAAVGKGDRGSTEDLGYMPRGILEPAPEYELFSLPKGGVGGPVDTPRGFWIVRRIE
jgi:hypothetical protein